MDTIIVAHEIVDLQERVIDLEHRVAHYLAALERIARRRREMAECPAQASVADALYMGDVAKKAIERT